MRLKPLKILIRVARVDHDEVFRIAVFVNEHIVHRAAILIAEHGISAAAGRHSSDVVGEHGLQIGKRIFAAHKQLTHVGNIEQAAAFPHGFVFFQDGRILHRQRPAAEIDHLAAQGDVNIIQGCFFQRIHWQM